MGSKTKETPQEIDHFFNLRKRPLSNAVTKAAIRGENWMHPNNKATRAAGKKVDLLNSQVIRLFDRDDLTPGDMKYLFDHAEDHGNGISFFSKKPEND